MFHADEETFGFVSNLLRVHDSLEKVTEVCGEPVKNLFIPKSELFSTLRRRNARTLADGAQEMDMTRAHAMAAELAGGTDYMTVIKKYLYSKTRSKAQPKVKNP